MERLNIFCDFDGTICNSSKAYCDAYNVTYFDKEGFQEADHTKVTLYNLTDQCSLANTQEKVRDIFAGYEFWSWLEFMDDAKEVLERLNEKYNLIICSIGTNLNLSRKSKWINQNLPFIHNCILINNGNNIMDKSIVDMNGGILIDDVASNLKTSNAQFKLCFGQMYDWNKDLPDGCIRANDWFEVEKYINMITSKESLIE